jgi:hypothetical protein
VLQSFHFPVFPVTVAVTVAASHSQASPRAPVLPFPRFGCVHARVFPDRKESNPPAARHLASPRHFLKRPAHSAHGLPSGAGLNGMHPAGARHGVGVGPGAALLRAAPAPGPLLRPPRHVAGGGVRAGAARRAGRRLLHGRRQVGHRGAQDRADAGVAGLRARRLPRPRRRAPRRHRRALPRGRARAPLQVRRLRRAARARALRARQGRLPRLGHLRGLGGRLPARRGLRPQRPPPAAGGGVPLRPRARHLHRHPDGVRGHRYRRHHGGKATLQGPVRLQPSCWQDRQDPHFQGHRSPLTLT